jgi:hypothetical protein
MTRRLHVLAFLSLFSAAGCFSGPPDKGDEPLGPECQLDTEKETVPGYPFDINAFTDNLLPVITSSCAGSSCHGAPSTTGNFTVWPGAAAGNCDFGKSFNSVADNTDLQNPTNSPIYFAISGGDAGHPVKLTADDPKLQTILAYVTDASETYIAGGGGITPPAGNSPFDEAVFGSTIQPMIDATGCAVDGCHGTGAGTLTLKASPAAGSADFDANFLAVTSRCSLDNPPGSLFYLQATTAHSGGVTTPVSTQNAAALLDWIQKAKEANGDPGGQPTGCAPLDKFNLGIFTSEILPILNGDLDLNNANGQGNGAGCTSSQCHGADRGPGTLTLVPGSDPAEQLQSFACYVNLQAPSTSNILRCPLNDPSCPKYPHPGQDIFADAADLNYQRVLAYVYGSQLDSSPLDFAFFARRINPIFDDINAVEDGAQGQSCSAVQACHGIQIAGQPPGNGSDFGIIPNASDFARLSFNFVQATGMSNFLDPDQSSLFLYPTNEIADRDNNPLATGLAHPGGIDFATDDLEALAILQWVGGLRPDGQGFQLNWLVAGDYPATQISDQTLINESNITPKIFDEAGGSFNSGEWDGFFSANQLVDLNQVFPRAATSGRVGYAVAYIINTSSTEIPSAQLQISTDNPVRIYIGNQLAAQNDAGGDASAFVNLPAAGSGQPAVRVLVKILQRANDANFAFSAQLKDQFGNPLTDATQELVLTLSPNGGI